MTRIVTIICWAVAALVMIGLVFWLITGSLFGIQTGVSLSDSISFGITEAGSGPHNIEYEYTAPADGIDSLRIDWVSGGITVTTHSGSDIRIVEYARRELDDDEHLRHSSSGSTLTIDYMSTRLTGTIPSKLVEVYLPAELADSLSLVKTDSTSADVSIGGITTQILDIDTVSGNVTVTGVSADAFSISSVSGDGTLTDVISADLSFDSTSGGLVADASQLDAVEVDTVSGKCNIEGQCTSIKFNSTSGGLELRSSTVLDSVKIDTTSGDTELYIPEADGISVRHDTVSGRFTSDFGVSMVSKDARYDFCSTSGNVKIFEY